MALDILSYLMGQKSAGGGCVPTPGLPYVMNRSGTAAQRLICTLNGRQFYKAYDDPAFAAYATLTNGFAMPLLVSATQDGAKYGQNYNTDICLPAGSLTYNGVLFYYSGYDFILQANTSTDGFAEHLGLYDPSVSGWHEQAARDLLAIVFGT